MTLRFKAIAIVLVLFVVLFGALQLITYKIILQSFARLERDLTQQNIERVEGALAREVTSLETISRDWAVWDDTYEYLDNRNSKYAESNLHDGTFVTLKLNLMIIADNSGNIIFGKVFDLEKKEALPVPPGLVKHISDNRSLLIHPQNTLLSGIISLPENPILIASHLVLTSDEQGPSRGTLVMGRYLDAPKLEQLSEQTLLSFSLFPCTEPQLLPDVKAALSSLSDKTRYFIQPLSSDVIAGYTVLDDMYGKPAMILRMDTPRDVYHQGRTSYKYYLVVILLIGVASMIAVIFFLERQVLSRLASLGKSVSAIGKSGVPLSRISVTGKDELAGLAKEINRMLASIDRFQGELNEKNKQLGIQAEELKIKQQQLEEKGNELENASQAKSDFIAHLSHEIRTPLNAILGFSELMLDDIPGATNEDQKQCLKDIYNSGQLLLHLVNDVLDLSKIEAGKIDIKMEKLNLPVVIQYVIQTIKPMIETSKHQLSINIPDGLPPVYADEKRLMQVILNLLGNAVKFTPPGGKLAIEAAFSKDREWCEVSIIDNGIGIRKDDQQRIFEAFVQADITPQGTATGTGLGLTLTREFTRFWGGRIWVESEYGKSSKFTFTVPFFKDQTIEKG